MLDKCYSITFYRDSKNNKMHFQSACRLISRQEVFIAIHDLSMEIQKLSESLAKSDGNPISYESVIDR